MTCTFAYLGNRNKYHVSESRLTGKLVKVNVYDSVLLLILTYDMHGTKFPLSY